MSHHPITAMKTAAAFVGLLMLGGLTGLPGLDVPAASASDEQPATDFGDKDHDEDKNSRFGRPADDCQFEGKWVNERIGTLRLHQDDHKVFGSYPDGRLFGRVDGHHVKGVWKRYGGDSGQLRMVMSDDCDTIKARWRYGDHGRWRTEYFGLY